MNLKANLRERKAPKLKIIIAAVGIVKFQCSVSMLTLLIVSRFCYKIVNNFSRLYEMDIFR